ncbi:MAG: DNA repair protein RecO [Candidatus Levyibacteriota bacterium]
MRNFRTEGIIIKRKNYGEADRILTVLTRDYGKISIKATGVRKITSRRSAHIELLNHTILHLYRKSTFNTLTEAKMMEDFSKIKQDFHKVGLAYHLCELVDGLCPENQENSTVYFLLKKTLEQLAKSTEVIPMQEYPVSDISDYMIGTFGMGVSDASQKVLTVPSRSQLLQDFEVTLLSELGYWNKNDALKKNFDTHAMIESIIERKLKSHAIFAKLQ